MDEPAFLLDAARVLRYASLVPRGAGYSAVVGGVPVDSSTVRGLAVTESIVDGSIYLLHCTVDWETVAATSHQSADAAQAFAGEAYVEATQSWTPYRALTEDEEREIRTTREFLRELAADPGL
ncbi:MAG TPA: hypothetical protein VH301_03465 [Usitatibacter sp.]|jgi:hypothetical protein|nr:hypothetical protein [Usitatibacter sp.]